MKFKKLLATICSFLLAATSFLSGGSARAETVNCKIFLIGDAKSGKTRLYERFISIGYDDSYIPTVVMSIFQKDVDFNSKTVKLGMWDIPGHERFRDIIRSYFRGTHIFLLCIDLQGDIGEQYERWRKEVNEHGDKDENGELKAEVVLIGTKCDSVDTDRIQQFINFAEEKDLYYCITSAKKNDHVENGNGVSISFEGFVQELAKMFLGPLNPEAYTTSENTTTSTIPGNFETDDFNQDDSSWSTGKKIAVGAGVGVVTVGGILATVFGVKHDQNKKENKTKVPKAQKNQNQAQPVSAV